MVEWWKRLDNNEVDLVRRNRPDKNKGKTYNPENLLRLYISPIKYSTCFIWNESQWRDRWWQVLTHFWKEIFCVHICSLCACVMGLGMQIRLQSVLFFANALIIIIIIYEAQGLDAWWIFQVANLCLWLEFILYKSRCTDKSVNI